MTSRYKPSYRPIPIPTKPLRFHRLSSVQWLASTGHVVGVQGVPGSKSGQDIMTFVPTLSSFIHPSLPFPIRTLSALGLIKSIVFHDIKFLPVNAE